MPRSIGRTAISLVLAPSLACTLVIDTGELAGGPRAAPDGAVDAGPASGDGSSPEGGSVEAAAPDGPSFHDGFDRPDGPALGNGWTVKAATGYSVVGGVVAKGFTNQAYWDNLVYRPVSEDRRDVEVSVAVTVGSGGQAYPQVFARAQRDTIAKQGQYAAYQFFVSEEAFAMIGRQRGGGQETDLQKVPLSGILRSGVRARLTFRVTGEIPTLEGKVELASGDGWAEIGRASVVDDSPARLTTAGAVGFTASNDRVAAFDDFTWRALVP